MEKDEEQVRKVTIQNPGNQAITGCKKKKSPKDKRQRYPDNESFHDFFNVGAIFKEERDREREGAAD